MNSADGREVAMAAVKHLKERRAGEEFDIYSWETLEESEQLGRWPSRGSRKPFCTCC